MRRNNRHLPSRHEKLENENDAEHFALHRFFSDPHLLYTIEPTV